MGQIVEIKGVKLDVDLREATAVETLRVGDPVRVLKKNYGDTFAAHSGCVIGFDQFKELPTIVVAYIEASYSDASVKFLHYNEQSKDCEVIRADSATVDAFDEKEAIAALDRRIEKCAQDLKGAESQRAYFIENIRRAWAPQAAEA